MKIVLTQITVRSLALAQGKGAGGRRVAVWTHSPWGSLRSAGVSELGKRRPAPGELTRTTPGRQRAGRAARELAALGE